MKENLIEKYARLIVEVGCNLQPGQILVIQVKNEEIELARAVTKAAFAAKAKDVVVFIEDNEIQRLRALNADKETLETVAPWKKEALEYFFKDDAVQMVVFGSYPEVMSGIDEEKALAVGQADNDLRNVVRKYIHAGTLQWVGTIWPNLEWAKQVYPQLDEQSALKQLEKDFCLMLRIDDESDPVVNWHKHCEELSKISSALNQANFKTLHIKTGLGTDLTLDLVKNHRWGAASENGESKTRANYLANLPTEEIYCVPDYRQVNGKVVAALPLVVSGKLVTDFGFNFVDGLATEAWAKDNEEVLRKTIFADDSTRRLGEVALVSKHSPISQLKRVYYNGLIDENAASHLAFGASFPSNVAGGLDMSKEELLANGINQSPLHLDFMIGTDDMEVVGYTYDGKAIPIMENGEFVL